MPLLKSDYEDLFLLESGGQSQIWLGLEKGSARALCLRQTPASEQELIKLTQVHQGLQHPGLLGFVGFGLDQGHWSVHPYFHGISLQQAQSLSEAQVLALALQWTEALSYLHRQGLKHGDLHPGNLMLNGQGQAIILDFANGLELSSGIAGRTQYLSPEHLHNQINASSDLFCLGLCLLRALRAQDAISECPISQLPNEWASLDLSDLSDAWQSVLGSCLALDPMDRPETAEELNQALKSLELELDKPEWHNVQNQTDLLFAQRLRNSQLPIEAHQKYCLYWMQISPQSDIPIAYFSELKHSAQPQVIQNTGDPVVLPKLPLGKFLIFKALFLCVVGALVWWLWPSTSHVQEMDKYTDKALDQKSNVRKSKEFNWVKLPDSLCKHWSYEGSPKSSKILLKPGSYVLECNDDKKAVKYHMQYDSQTGVKWSPLP